MQMFPMQLSDVIYNPATQRFEALVTVHDPSQARRYACAIDAPINMGFEEAAEGLTIQAMRRHGRKDARSVPNDAGTWGAAMPDSTYTLAQAA